MWINEQRVPQLRLIGPTIDLEVLLRSGRTGRNGHLHDEGLHGHDGVSQFRRNGVPVTAKRDERLGADASLVSASDATARGGQDRGDARLHPGWGPRTIETRLRNQGVVPVPGRSSIYRCLIRHGLVTPEARKNVMITSGGSARGRWNCGRWTSSAV